MGDKILLSCKNCDGFVSLPQAGGQNVVPGLSPAKDALSILWPPRLSVRPVAALLGALVQGTAGAAAGGQSGDCGAAPGPLAMAEGPEGITPELCPKEFREGLSWGAGNCWGGDRTVKGSSCNGRLVISSLQSVFCNVGFVR